MYTDTYHNDQWQPAGDGQIARLLVLSSIHIQPKSALTKTIRIHATRTGNYLRSAATRSGWFKKISILEKERTWRHHPIYKVKWFIAVRLRNFANKFGPYFNAQTNTCVIPRKQTWQNPCRKINRSRNTGLPASSSQTTAVTTHHDTATIYDKFSILWLFWSFQLITDWIMSEHRMIPMKILE